ncbi:hypothetical protein ABEU88_09035, partial [Caldifermentibacillus hisashii]
DALEAIQAFKKKQKTSYFCYELNVQMSDQPVKRKKRGRPKKDEHITGGNLEKNVEFNRNLSKIHQKMKISPHQAI